MVGIGTGCFLQFPGNSKQRILHPALVTGLSEEVCTVQCEENDLPAEADMDVLLYFERNREFMQQSGRIETVDTVNADDGDSDEPDPKCLIGFKTTGEPVSAESRQHYRVSTVITGYQAALESETACPVLDISSTGLAIVSKQDYAIGNVVVVTIDENGKTYTGSVCVQSVRELGESQTRYGMHCVSESKANDTLGEGLQRANMRVQREQLRRLAATG